MLSPPFDLTSCSIPKVEVVEDESITIQIKSSSNSLGVILHILHITFERSGN
jgi:hypothetical protein